MHHPDRPPQIRRAARPSHLPLGRTRQMVPIQPQPLRLPFGVVGENRIKNPPEKRHAQDQPPDDAPLLAQAAHSSPQSFFKWATPPNAASGESEGLNSNTLTCSGFTTPRNDAKSTFPLPGGR